MDITTVKSSIINAKMKECYCKNEKIYWGNYEKNKEQKRGYGRNRYRNLSIRKRKKKTKK